MCDADAHWAFSADFNQVRRARLECITSFAAVVDRIRGGTIENFVWEPGAAPRLKGLKRAAFLIRVSRETYDAFFNSPQGYRAQYAKSAERGVSANRDLLNSLESRLLAYSRQTETTADGLILSSLRGEGAKGWICEGEVQSHMGSSAPEILYGPWVSATTDGAGLLAPVGTLIEVKGAWVNSHGEVVTDPFKIRRAQEIHEVGYS
jgi:hypothetical protein